MSEESVNDADVAHPHGIASGIDLDHDVVDRLHGLELRVREHVVVEVARFDVARGEYQVGGFHGLDHVEDGESSRLQQRRDPG